MRAAARGAGLKTFVHLPEQEAALYQILCYERLNKTVFKTGDIICVADAGGGTADLGSYRLEIGGDGEWTAMECERSTGSLSGGDRIDLRMDEMMAEALNPTLWQEYKSDSEYLTCMFSRHL